MADALSAPGSSTYSSNTMVVGDGTWDFTKNTFLLPNLVGLNFDTMQLNGMGNRFSTFTEYHNIIAAHGVLAAIVFLFIIPISVMLARFHRGRDGRQGVHLHGYMNVLAVLLTTVVFILGFFAVGPPRSLTNPHHGIGVAIYVLMLLQIIGGRLISHIRKNRSLRIMLHQWGGRTISLLGIVQIPLGLTLYGSPKFTFILYTLWMSFLVLVYFILSYRKEGYREELMIHGGRSTAGRSDTDVTRRKSGMGWLGPLAGVAGAAGLWALMRGRNKNRDRSTSRARSRSHSRPPEVIPSRRGSASYVEDEKYTQSPPRRRSGNWTNRLLGVAGVIGAGAVAKRMLDRREKRRYDDEEYSAVATDTPSRHNRRRSRTPGPSRRHDDYTESEFSEDRTELSRPGGRRSSILPGPGDPVTAAAALSAAEPRPYRPRTPRPIRPGHSRHDSELMSDYSSYDSPSKVTRTTAPGAGTGLMAGLGLGWLASRWGNKRKNKAEEERLRLEDERLRDEEDRRDGRHGSRYTGDGFVSPTRRSSRRYPPTASGRTAVTHEDSASSIVESRPPRSGVSGPPMPPIGAVHPTSASNIPPIPPTGGAGSSAIPLAAGAAAGAMAGSSFASRSRVTDLHEPAAMPTMPPDPHGVLHPLTRDESGSEAYMSAGGHPHRRHSSRRRREGEAAAMAAAATGSAVAADEERRRRSTSRGAGQPVSVKVKYHDDRNVTLRRLTEEEQAASSRREQRRQRSSSMSSVSGSEAAAGRRRYRRDSSSARRTADEAAAERFASEPLSPPAPAFAGGRRGKAKDSAYYSGQPGPSGTSPLAAQTMSSIGSPESHATMSGMSPSPSGPGGASGTPLTPSVSAADRRRRRRLERRDQNAAGTVEYS